MSARREPEEVLASIRRLVAREVEAAQDRDRADAPASRAAPVISSRALAAAQMARDGEEGPASNAAQAPKSALEGEVQPQVTRALDPDLQGAEAPESEVPPSKALSLDAPVEPLDDLTADLVGDASEAPSDARDTLWTTDVSQIDEVALRDLIRAIQREEVRTRMGPRINANIRRIVREELAALFAEPAATPPDGLDRPDG